MQNSQKALRCIVGAVLFLLTLGISLALIFALSREYDPGIRHFAVRAPLAMAAALILAAAVVGSAVLGVAAAIRRRPLALRADAPALLFTSMLAAFLLLATFILEITSGGNILVRIRLALCALSAVYFFLVTNEKSRGGALPCLSLLPILYALASVLHIYFDPAYAMNAPLKTLSLMMYISLALFFTGEARWALGRFRAPSYLFFASLAVILPTVGAAARLYLTAAQVPGHTFPLTESAALLAIALFAAVRLFSIGDAPEEAADAPSDSSAENTDGQEGKHHA